MFTRGLTHIGQKLLVSAYKQPDSVTMIDFGFGNCQWGNTNAMHGLSFRLDYVRKCSYKEYEGPISNDKYLTIECHE